MSQKYFMHLPEPVRQAILELEDAHTEVCNAEEKLERLKQKALSARHKLTEVLFNHGIK